MLLVSYSSWSTEKKTWFEDGVKKTSSTRLETTHVLTVRGSMSMMGREEEPIGDAIARRADLDLHDSYFTRALDDLSSWLSSREGIGPNFEIEVSKRLSQKHLEASRRLGFRAREIRFRLDEQGRPEVSVDPFIPPTQR